MAVQSDGAVLVTERIQADFQGETQHGIYRDIPLVTKDSKGLRQSIRLSFLGARDEDGRPWNARLSRIGAYQRIRLGSSSVTFSGKKTFEISYRVDRILQPFPDHDELYWNVTGDGWTVPIRQAAAAVHFPKPVPPGSLHAAAYTGRYGSSAQDASLEIGETQVRFAALYPLAPDEGLTVVVGWPKGLVRMPSRIIRLKWFFQDNGLFLIPMLVLGVMAVLWWRFGRDLPLESIPVRYEPPPGLSPAETGTLVDDRADMKDITATIVDLARRGHLTIEEQEGKEYLLKRRSGGEEPLKSHESLLLNGLFSGSSTKKLSDLSNHFYKELPEIHAALYGSLMNRGCWWGRPTFVRGSWAAVAAALFVAGWFALFSEAFLLAAALWGSGLIVGLFVPFMPKRTPEGARILEQTLGFREFLKRTDQDRLRRESDPGALFERMLPYAMALGVADRWARSFEGIYSVRPTWYSGWGGSPLSPSDFTRRLNQAGTQMGSVLGSTPNRSGGSGFSGGSSGGGGGGGGGGSW